ncbi:MAG: hypothetical protein G01um101438_741 [Parcubacteria group bacterium Gr01-1014_38]|nr:MAG: hypothetical protein G01um101438_741 [Parcubacteria group bacterium Gr01-1014_38]
MSGFRLLFHPAIRRDLRKLPKQTAIYLVQEVFPAIAEDPFRGVRLSGELKDLWKVVAHHGGVSYRIVYEPDTRARTIFVLSVGARGGFYERLRRRVG